MFTLIKNIKTLKVLKMCSLRCFMWCPKFTNGLLGDTKWRKKSYLCIRNQKTVVLKVYKGYYHFKSSKVHI